MAENLVAIFDLLSSPQSGWNMGDRVHVYWDDSNSNLVVRLNTTLKTSGPELGTQELDYLAFKLLYQVCDGTILKTFDPIEPNPFFPYVDITNWANSPLCNTGTNPLEFSSVVVSDANEGQDDGAITATANNGGASTIEYALGNFTVSYGNGQTTGVFTGLSPGQYFVKARDASGQEITQKVQVDEIASISTVKITGIKGSSPTTPGGSDGTIIVSASGDATPFTYKLIKSGVTTSNGTGIFTGLSSGVYNVQVIDQVNWTAYGTHELIDPAVCDLEVTNTTFTHVTTQGGNDGSISVTATSTNGPIEYSLGPFPGAYGTGSSTATFSTLSAGNYSVYIRDSVCSTVVVGTIQDGQALTEDQYGVLYRLEYNDLAGNTTRFDIGERGYTGSFTEVNGGETPLIYSKPEVSSNNIFDPVHPGFVSVTLESETNFKYRDLYTSDEKKYIGKWYKDTGHGFELYFVGFLQPEVFKEPYLPPPYDVTLVFTDGLTLLKRKPFLPGNVSFGEDLEGLERFGGSVSLAQVLSNVLRKTGLTLPYNIAVNMYEDSFSSGDTDDPLFQTYVSQSAFYPDNEPMDCLTILEEVLKPFGARIFQWGAEWKIRRVKEEIATYDFRRYSYAGNAALNGRFNPIINYDSYTETGQRVHALDNSLTYEIQPSYKSIVIDRKLNLQNSILLNYDFSNFDVATLQPKNWQLKLNGATISGNVLFTTNDNSYSYSFNTHRWTNSLRNTQLQAVQREITWAPGDSIKVSLDFSASMRFEGVIIKVKVNIGDQYWLREDGSWEATETDLRFYPSNEGGFNTVDIEATLPTVSNVTTDTIDVSVYAFQGKNPDFGNWSGGTLSDGESVFRAFATADLPVKYKVSVYSETLNASNEKNNIFIYELEDADKTESEPDIIRPDDYATTTNEKVWILKEQARIDPTNDAADTLPVMTNRRYFIDNIVVLQLPNGFDPPEEAQYKLIVNEQAFESLPIDLYLGDLGTDSLSKNMYDNYFTDSSGNLTSAWTRDGVNESNFIQLVLLAQMGFQYNTPSSKISGTITGHNRNGQHLEITPENVIKETHDGDKGYWISKLTINDKNLSYDVILVELKGTTGTSGDNTGDGSAGDNAYNKGYSLGYKA